MANVWLKQSSFATGEVSPDLALSREDDLQRMRYAGMTVRNRVIQPAGNAPVRAGFEFIAATKYADRKCRFARFVYSDTQKFFIELGHLYARFFSIASGSQVLSGGVPYEIATCYTEDELDDISYCQSADVMFITHPDHPIQLLTRYADNNWTFGPMEIVNGPFITGNVNKTKTITPSATTGTISLVSSFDFFQAGHVGSLLKMTHRIAGQSVTGNFTDVATSATVYGKGIWKAMSHGTWTAKWYLEKSVDKGATWTIHRSYSGANDYNPIESEQDDELAMFRLRCYEYTSGTVKYELIMQPHEWSGIVRITAVTDSKHATAVVMDDYELGSATATYRWEEGAWSDIKGYPGCCIFFQDRLFLGSTKTDPNMQRTSESGVYNSFKVSDPQIASDAIGIPIAAREANQAKSLVAFAEVLVMTGSGEFRVGPGQDGVMSYNSLNAVAQGFRGIGSVDPVIVGNRVIYAQAGGKVIRDLGYQLAEDSYTGVDLTVMATHLFKTSPIVAMAYQPEPESVIWCAREDGLLLGLTYNRDQEVWGWHRHDTQGFFEDIGCVQGLQNPEVWAVIRRTINNQTVRYIERQAQRVPSGDPADQRYLDCFAEYLYASPVGAITGLRHLEGKIVNVLADGSVAKGLLVTGGNITLPQPAKNICVGLGYVADLEQCNAEFQARDGTVQGRPKKINQVILRVENSRGGWIGPTFDRMDPIIVDPAPIWGSPPPLFTGDLYITFPGEYEPNGRVCIRQDDPLPQTILAIIKEVSFVD